MKIIDGLLAELEQEATTTRRVLERIPQEHLSWRPHPKSMSLGQLALHVATVPGFGRRDCRARRCSHATAFVQPEAATAAELVPALAESVAKAKRALGSYDDAKMAATWRLQSDGREMIGDAARRSSFARSC